MSEWDRHLMTRKHEKMTNTKKYEEIRSKKTPESYNCECGKQYKHPQSLWNHRRSCTYIISNYNDNNNQDNTINPDDISSDREMIKSLFTIIQQQHAQLLEMSKNGGTNHSHNTTHNNSHNKTFNLQFFLNETCKDAMNITDFVNSLKITLNDLEKVGELGYSEGISRMFVKGLNDLDVTKRPIHCSDSKREILHIKDQDKWEKDDNKEILTKAIKDVSTKNLMLMSNWQKENPGCTEYNHRKNDMYLKLMSNSVGPLDKQGEKKEFGKIMRTVAKNTIIDKNKCY